MTDTEIIDFIEKHEVQFWPERLKEPGSNNWVAQHSKPFKQCTRRTLRAAITDLADWFNQAAI